MTATDNRIEIRKEIGLGYHISNLGRIKSYNKKIPRILKVCSNGTGYMHVYLKLLNKTFYIHRLVAKAFIPNLGNKKCVNHKNGIRDDNGVANLERCTSSENSLHSNYVLGTGYVGKFGKLHPRSKKINQWSKRGELIKTRDSGMSIERELGYACSNIFKCCIGKYKSAYGYKRTLSI